MYVVWAGRQLICLNENLKSLYQSMGPRSCEPTTLATRLEIIMLQIFAIILFSNSLILLLLFSQFSAIILIILRLKELSFVILQHERTFYITGWRAGPAWPTHLGAPRASPITSIYACYYSRTMLYANTVLLFSKLFPHNYCKPISGPTIQAFVCWSEAVES